MASKRPTWGDQALAVWSLLQDRPVAYHPELARVLGDVKAAILLGQLMYWSDKGTWRPGWIIKTREEIEDETALTRYEQERARKHLVKLGVLHEERRGVPARLNYQVDMQALSELTATYMAAKVEEPPDGGKTPNKTAGNPPTNGGKTPNKNAEDPPTISENTTETTLPETVIESDADASHSGSVLDEVFPEQAEVKDGKEWKEGHGNLTDEEKAQMASPAATATKADAGDPVMREWQRRSSSISYPHGLGWRDVYELAMEFSNLSNLAVPSNQTTIGQWRKGIVQCVAACADSLNGHSTPETIRRNAKWAMQVLFARRDMGDAWTFDVVSPLSISNTVRVIMADKKQMLELHQQEPGHLPEPAEILTYYNQRPDEQARRARNATGAEVTLLTIQNM